MHDPVYFNNTNIKAGDWVSGVTWYGVRIEGFVIHTVMQGVTIKIIGGEYDQCIETLHTDDVIKQESSLLSSDWEEMMQMALYKKDYEWCRYIYNKGKLKEENSK